MLTNFSGHARTDGRAHGHTTRKLNASAGEGGGTKSAQAPQLLRCPRRGTPKRRCYIRFIATCHFYFHCRFNELAKVKRIIGRIRYCLTQ